MTWRRKQIYLSASLLLVIIVITSITAWINTQTSEQEFVVILHSIPFKDPVSTYVKVRSDGQAVSIRYYRNSRKFDTAREGVLSREAVSSLSAKIRGYGFRAALLKGYFYKEAEFPNLFTIVIQPSNKIIRGQEAQAPESVREVIRALLNLTSEFSSKTNAVAYLRCTPVKDYRFRRLMSEVKEGKSKLRFHNLSELSKERQSIVTPAIEQPEELYPLRQGPYDRISGLAGDGGDFYVVDKDTGYEFVLYIQSKQEH